MPRPIFIICSESGADDKASGLTSVFNIFDRIFVTKAPPAAGETLVQFKMRIVAVWMREDDDSEDQEFEIRLFIKSPDGTEKFIAQIPFTFSADKHFFRSTFLYGGALPNELGLMEVQCKLRRSNTEDYLSVQSYPIVIEEVPATADEPADAPQAAG